MRRSWDATMMRIAEEMAQMGTCARRQVACVLTDQHNNILSTGVNGVPPKWEHCRSFGDDAPGRPCSGANSPSGTNLENCVANHAEINALLRCADKNAIHTCYTTVSPCIHCIKALLCTSTRRIIFKEEYPHEEAKRLWLSNSFYQFHIHGGTISGHRVWLRMASDGLIDQVSSSGLK